MRRVIGGDDIDGAVFYAFDQRGAIFFAAERRIHFEPPVLLQIVFGKQKIMRRGFAGYVRSAALRLADGFHAFLGGNVADVVFHARFFGKAQIAPHLHIFAGGIDALMPVFPRVFSRTDAAAVQQRFVLAVRGKHFARRFDSDHRFAHRFFGLNALSVIRKAAYKRSESFYIR